MANPKILICDEKEDVRESLKVILADHYELVLVDCSDMVLEILSHTKDIKIVLLNIKMPEIQRKFPHVKIITDIVKPFKSQDILEIVKENLEA
jgi:PleD family two-component response regulator